MPDVDHSKVLRPVATASGLPNENYVSDDVFQIEKQRLLFDNWAAIGFAKDVPEAGDANPITFLDVRLLVVRDNNNKVHVYQNTCRHRGMILVEEKRKIGGLVRCPYHSWCYALTGELITTPHVGGPGTNTHPEIQRDDLGLTEIRSHIWRDIVFVNISGTAAPFEEYAAEAIARWSEFEEREFHHAGDDSSFSFDVACNWKLAVENYCESYHLPWVHPGLNSYSRLEDHYHIEQPGKFSGQGTEVYRPTISEDGQKFPDYSDLSDKWDVGAEYIALYPNVLLGAHRDHAFAIILEPRAKDHTIEHVEVYYASEDAVGPNFAELRKANAALWHSVLEEDLFVVEGMQKGRHAVYFDGGKFSPVMDGPTHCFHQWVATQLSDSPVAAG